MKITCLAFLCCLSSFLFAQKGGALCSSVTQKIDDKPYCYKGPALDSVEVFAFIPGTTDTIRGISDSTGDVRIKPVPPGIYTVRAKFPGYAPAEYQGVIVAEMKNTYMCIEMIPVTAPDKKSKKRNRKK